MNKESNTYKQVLIILTIFLCSIFTIYIHQDVQYKNHKRYLIIEDKIHKIDEIIDCISNRNIVKDTDLLYIDDLELVEKIKAYNTKTYELSSYYELTATNIMMDIGGLIKEGVLIRGTDIPDEYHEAIERISKYALYRNATELITADYKIYKLMFHEIGGSAGNFPRFIHGGYMSEELYIYFDTSDEVTIGLMKYKEEMIK